MGLRLSRVTIAAAGIMLGEAILLGYTVGRGSVPQVGRFQRIAPATVLDTTTGKACRFDGRISGYPVAALRTRELETFDANSRKKRVRRPSGNAYSQAYSASGPVR
jgi:hypothetical protein